MRQPRAHPAARPRALSIINIDHHATGHEWAQLNWIDREAVSVGEMVYRLVKAAGATITPEMATCLYTTCSPIPAASATAPSAPPPSRWRRNWSRPAPIPFASPAILYFSTPASKLLLLGAALSNLHREGRLAWLWVTQQDMVRTCAAEEDCEGIVNYALSVAGVEAAVFLRELPERQHPRQPAQQGPGQCGRHCRTAGRRRPRERRRLHPGWTAAAARSIRFWPNCAPPSRPARPNRIAGPETEPG